MMNSNSMESSFGALRIMPSLIASTSSNAYFRQRQVRTSESRDEFDGPCFRVVTISARIVDTGNARMHEDTFSLFGTISRSYYSLTKPLISAYGASLRFIYSMGLTQVLIILAILPYIFSVRTHTWAPARGYPEQRSGEHVESQSVNAKYVDVTGLAIGNESMDHLIAETAHSLMLTRRSFEGTADQQVGRLYPLLERAMAAADLSEQCSHDILQVIGFASQQHWAVQCEYDYPSRQLSPRHLD